MDEEGGEGIKRSQECVVLVMIEMISAGEVNQLIEDNKKDKKTSKIRDNQIVKECAKFTFKKSIKDGGINVDF